jgi:murein DD-endopeptidase MepM/ murein hydrolase activator NlpD
MILASNNRVTQGKHGKYNAVDISAKPDPTIYAPEDGKITAYGASGSCGNRLELTAGANRHGFCHLERPLVKAGQNVKKGQKIGVMGYTGYTIPSGPAGAHLHWVIRRNGIYVYPPSLVNEKGVNEMADSTQVKNLYKAILHRNADKGGLSHYTGQDANNIVSAFLKSTEWKNHDKFVKTATQQIKDLQEALKNEKNKKPETIIKEVEKIVEKTVEVPVEVFTEVEVVKEVEKPYTWNSVVGWVINQINKLRNK